jgi:radical SAM protein with 4Fe4S-binding SPASM domain
MRREEYFCPKPWQNLMIKVDGRCYFCCFISPEDGALGNIATEEFDEIWNGAKARRIRHQIARGKLPFECRACALFGEEKHDLSPIGKVLDYLRTQRRRVRMALGGRREPVPVRLMRSTRGASAVAARRDSRGD